MLQQTQVQTVIGYFERFVGRFPDASALASAELDEVLHLWSGLGYYARARNLHQTAGILAREYGGELPADIDALQALPGIGRSTAGAIAAMGHGLRAPILDGNVKRVLARLHAIDGWPGQSAVARDLWTLAERYTPSRRVADYTQAIMDLGATVCTRRDPDCPHCPLRTRCRAHAAGIQHRLPAPRPKRPLPRRRWRWLIERNPDGHVRLVQRPPSGLWGGLWAFPAWQEDSDDRAHPTAPKPRRWGRIEHGFTHFRVTIDLLLRDCEAAPITIAEAPSQWVDPANPPPLGLATPVRRILESLVSSEGNSPQPIG